MTDSSGRAIAGYRKKLLSLHATAYITAEINGQTLVFATIRWTGLYCAVLNSAPRKASLFSMESSADIFIHEVSTSTAHNHPTCGVPAAAATAGGRQDGGAQRRHPRGWGHHQQEVGATALMSGRTEELSHFLLGSLICTIILQLF